MYDEDHHKTIAQLISRIDMMTGTLFDHIILGNNGTHSFAGQSLPCASRPHRSALLGAGLPSPLTCSPTHADEKPYGLQHHPSVMWCRFQGCC
mgnify:CR=1 FL=1